MKKRSSQGPRPEHASARRSTGNETKVREIPEEGLVSRPVLVPSHPLRVADQPSPRLWRAGPRSGVWTDRNAGSIQRFAEFDDVAGRGGFDRMRIARHARRGAALYQAFAAASGRSFGLGRWDRCPHIPKNPETKTDREPGQKSPNQKSFPGNGPATALLLSRASMRISSFAAPPRRTVLGETAASIKRERAARRRWRSTCRGCWPGTWPRPA
jgi:hypothetical protein